MDGPATCIFDTLSSLDSYELVILSYARWIGALASNMLILPKLLGYCLR